MFCIYHLGEQRFIAGYLHNNKNVSEDEFCQNARLLCNINDK